MRVGVSSFSEESWYEDVPASLGGGSSGGRKRGKKGKAASSALQDVRLYRSISFFELSSLLFLQALKRFADQPRWMGM